MRFQHDDAKNTASGFIKHWSNSDERVFLRDLFDLSGLFERSIKHKGKSVSTQIRSEWCGNPRKTNEKNEENVYDITPEMLEFALNVCNIKPDVI